MRITHLATAIVASLGLVSAAHADPDTSPVSSSTHDFSVTLRIPWEFTFAPNNTQLGLGGLGLDIEKRVDTNTFAGVSADWTLGMDLTSGPRRQGVAESDIRTVSRFKGGLELRHIFHEGEASASVNDGPCVPIPRHDWIGARAGAETIDGGTTHGYFGELSIGMDGDMGGVQLGMYLSAGVSAEPAAAYGVPVADDDFLLPKGNIQSTPPSGTIAGPYVGMGMRIAFG